MRINTNSICLLLFTFLLSLGCKKRIILPSITTLSVSNIFANEATSGGVISSQGTGNILSRGVVWSTSPNPTISLSTKTTDNSGVGTFTSKLFGLSANTKYYVRAYATVATGTSYGNEVSFTTNDIDLKQGLVAYFPFTGNAEDSSGNGNHGTVNGAILTTDRFGNPNSAFSFDGINDFIEVQDDSTLDFTNKYSISVWVNIPDYSKSLGLPNGNIGADVSRAILNKPRTTGWADGYALKIEVNYDSLVYSLASNMNCCDNISVNSNSKPQLNTWTNYITTYDGNSFKFYVNGKLVNSKIVQFTHPNSSTSLFLGKSFHTVDFNWYEWYKGKIDDVKLYNRALTESEITYLATH